MGNPTPKKEQRMKCWTARDAYFKCCEDSQILFTGIAMDDEVVTGKKKETKGNNNFCGDLKRIFEQTCLESWKLHFENERVKEKQKEYLIKQFSKGEEDRAKSDEFWERVRKQ